MRILTVNCGSSSLKIALCDVTASSATTVAEIDVDSIGERATLSSRSAGGETSRRPCVAGDHREALNAALGTLGEEQSGAIDGIGHRVVQGGAHVSPCVIDDGVTAAIRAALDIAPLHNAPSLAGIEAAAERLPATPMVAVFDTAFHAALPEVASRYALPAELTVNAGIRRYGYHGIAHRSLVERYAALVATQPGRVTLVTLQLGSGCSAAAIRRGVSVDTSMGFTPIEGLVMGTRPGDVDPGALSYLMRREGVTPDELDRMLNHRSGLLALSGSSPDMSELLEAAAGGDERADAAIDVFCYRARKYIGAYLAVLGETDAVVLGGGVSRSPEVRRRICEPLNALGLGFDTARNSAIAASEGEFSEAESRIRAWFIPTDEERVIARDTFDVLAGHNVPVENAHGAG